jgi:hypothetical protein
MGHDPNQRLSTTPTDLEPTAGNDMAGGGVVLKSVSHSRVCLSVDRDSQTLIHMARLPRCDTKRQEADNHERIGARSGIAVIDEMVGQFCELAYGAGGNGAPPYNTDPSALR